MSRSKLSGCVRVALLGSLAWSVAALAPRSSFQAQIEEFPLPEAEIQVQRQVLMVARDGTKLAMEIYLPRRGGKYPTVITRTPYGKERTDSLLLSLARHGYAVVAQDCRGTGASEPADWDMYIHEKEDSYDTVEWVTRRPWYNGKIGAVGGSYVGETQWFMSFHPAMTAIMPEVAGIGKGRSNGVRLHMLIHAYAKSVGKAGGRRKSEISLEALERQMKDETWATGYFNDPLETPYSQHIFERFPGLRQKSEPERGTWMMEKYASLKPAERAELLKFLMGADEINYGNLSEMPPVFGKESGRPAFKYVARSTEELYRAIRAPALMISGWYDWGLDYTLDTWEMIQEHASPHVRENTRLLITPSAHSDLGYRDGAEGNPALHKRYRGKDNLELALRWYDYWLKGRAETLRGLARVSYYLMGANEWRSAETWPPSDTQFTKFFIDSAGDAWRIDGTGAVSNEPPRSGKPDRYTYDPENPTPTAGGSILSNLIPAGSTDQMEVQKRSDVLVYTSEVLKRDLEVTGPLKMLLFASSSAVDTDFTAKLTDVFPDGRALQIQNGMVRARYRNPGEAPSLIEPNKVYRYEIDMWATANLFRQGHRVRLEIASADFPRYERNSNLGGSSGRPVKALQTIFHDSQYPSHLVLPVMPRDPKPGR